jgi:hypothetical protein
MQKASPKGWLFCFAQERESMLSKAEAQNKKSMRSIDFCMLTLG